MWISIPSTTSRSVAEGQDSILDSNWLLKTLEQSVGLNGKPSLSNSWRLAWKRNVYLQRLFGRICDPSTASLGVASWIQSLRATRANHSVSPVSVVERTIQDTYGRKLSESLKKLNQDLCSWKTYQDISVLGTNKLKMTFKDWASKLRRACLQRRKSVQAKSVSDYSSSLWPAAQAHDSRGGKTRAQVQAMKKKTQAGVKNLNEVSVFFTQDHLWSTIRASDGDKGGPNQRFGAGGTPLPSQAVNFSHPDLLKMTGSESQPISGLQLNPVFVNWLMGWPKIVPDGSDSLETEWFHFKLRMRSYLYGLAATNEKAAA